MQEQEREKKEEEKIKEVGMIEGDGVPETCRQGRQGDRT